MKKLYVLASAVLLSAGMLSAQSPVNQAEAAPIIGSGNQNPASVTPWQLLFSYDITPGSGVGNAGIAVVGTEYWVSRWASDTISNYTITGTFISKFVVAGVTGTRSLTFDGTNVYAGCNTANIYKIDPVTKTLVSTIATGVTNIRYCTYDPTANSNAGGFWVGTWNTDIILVDMAGNALNGVNASSHMLTASYGMAYDNQSPGGPFLWSFHQTGSTNAADIIQVNIATGTQTGVMHDVTSDIGTAGDLAGGLYYNASTQSLLGVLQGAANYVFAYDLIGVGINEPVAQTEFISAYPNPANDLVNVRVNRTNNDAMTIELMDVTGKTVYQSGNVGINNYFDMSKYEAGVYIVKVTGTDGQSHYTRIVRN